MALVEKCKGPNPEIILVQTSGKIYEKIRVSEQERESGVKSFSAEHLWNTFKLLYECDY